MSDVKVLQISVDDGVISSKYPIALAASTGFSEEMLGEIIGQQTVHSVFLRSLIINLSVTYFRIEYPAVSIPARRDANDVAKAKLNCAELEDKLSQNSSITSSILF